jgi:hypothetical protein
MCLFELFNSIQSKKSAVFTFSVMKKKIKQNDNDRVEKIKNV